ncbi:MAG: hypothetical protein QT02_C0006G0043 [archaeon GW2011_AR9]|nr:MAG: hypothetical protein QT02_C0006G0043 [archaeon GW2011_AR9]MBS3120439.1 ABC transporter permease [Candidatus Woesearchaeota archaeon]HIG93738.1 ABC transporter permease [Candidatus Woesearchaeota archaeon]HIH12595.1 ABC transporter permease [Candidatus Woesearchaeota archaeon]
MIKDYFSLALTNLLQRRVRSWLTMIGIFIGIAAVIALISLGQGLQNAVNEQFSIIGADKIIISPKSAGFGPPGSLSAGKVTKDDIHLLEQVNGVDTVAGRLLKPVSLEFNDKLLITFAVSWPEDKGAMQLIQDFNNYQVAQGRMLNKQDNGKVMLGSSFAQDTAFGKAVRPGNNININGKKFKVIGIIESLGDPGRDNSVLMNEEEMRDLLDVPEEYSLLVAQISANANIDTVSADILRAFRRDRHVKEGKEDVEIQTPQQLLSSFTTILNVVQAVLIGIAAISLLVGGIGIMNTMYTSVLERTREIGIMKAIGASKQHILLLFLIESGLIGVLGGAIGIILGIALSKGVAFIAAKALGSALLQADISPLMIIFALLFSFAVGTISGLLPAKNAAELQPVEALRFE